MSEHIVRKVISLWLFSYSHFDPGKYLSPEMRYDIFDAIVPSRASFSPDAELAHVQTDVVIDHKELILFIYLIIIHKAAYAFPA